ncbi:hypothetical protein [Cellulomonas gilvus]|uniref:hypothetical protein n=1 Tax=Cellulomonas gilvus TaxID=11 RepID=UPI0002E61C3A|nr:hypothetical protein [Cellulomonas gilvus]
MGFRGRDGGIRPDGMAVAIGDALTGRLDRGDLRHEPILGPTTLGDEVTFTWDELLALPTDSKALRAVLEAEVREHAGVTDYRVYRAASELLTETPAPPQLRRALWEVLSALPEMTLGDPTTDALGRPGALVIADFSEARYGARQYVVDQETGVILEVRWMNPDNTAVAGRMTLVEQGPRDTAPAADPPLCGSESVPPAGC